MSKTNCCNCGAALDIFAPKCEFCGTKNINLTDIDLASGEAANFIFRLPHNIKGADGGEVYMSMLAVPELDTIEMVSDTVDITGLGGTQLASYTASNSLQMGLNLRAVSRPENNEICSLTYK